MKKVQAIIDAVEPSPPVFTATMTDHNNIRLFVKHKSIPDKSISYLHGLIAANWIEFFRMTTMRFSINRQQMLVDVADDVGRKILRFMRKNMPQYKEPTQTKLYRWWMEALSERTMKTENGDLLIEILLYIASFTDPEDGLATSEEHRENAVMLLTKVMENCEKR